MAKKGMASAVEIRSVETFEAMVHDLNKAFHAKIEKYGPHLFVVNSKHLSSQYLESFDTEAERKEHDCHACREFMRQYGNVVFINEKGNVVPALWDSSECGSSYAEQVSVLEHAVSKGDIVGQFFCAFQTLGSPSAGDLPHFHMTHSLKNIVTRGKTSPEAKHAISRENFRTLSHGLAEYNKDVLLQAKHLLQTASRKEKVDGIIDFLIALHEKLEGVRGKRRSNIIWAAVATAPVGFCTPRSNVVGTLLDELKEGNDPDGALRRFDDKMRADVYQRPQAAPSVGNVKQAEKLIADLGLEDSLRRRPALLDDVKLIWQPVDNKPTSSGVFGKLKTKNGKSESKLIESSNITKITWSKFSRTVLPEAVRIEHLVGRGAQPFFGVLTATEPDSKPILQWDSEDNRNRESLYTYVGGSQAHAWGLSANEYADVVGITFFPWMRDDQNAFKHFSKGVIFVLENAEDSQIDALCLFPETLRSELHQVRATIEAYSNETQLDVAEDGQHVCGIAISENKSSNVMLRVTTKTGISRYMIDRWD